MSSATQSLWAVPRLIAHRGASNCAPENTLAALQQAHHLGATWVEFDVRLAKCGTPIVFHDDTLNRTTNGVGKVSDYRYDDIVQLDAGSWFGDQFRGEKVPKFEDWLATAAKLGLGMNVELKATPDEAHHLAEEVNYFLKHRWPNHLPNPLVSSAQMECLHEIRNQSSHYLYGFITDRWLNDWEAVMRRFNCVSLHINHNEIDAVRVAKVQASGRHVLAYTVNDADRAKYLFQLGVEAVFSDNPALLSF